MHTLIYVVKAKNGSSSAYAVHVISDISKEDEVMPGFMTTNPEPAGQIESQKN